MILTSFLQNVYLLGTSLARPVIARGMIEVAAKEGCEYAVLCYLICFSVVISPLPQFRVPRVHRQRQRPSSIRARILWVET